MSYKYNLEVQYFCTVPCKNGVLNWWKLVPLCTSIAIATGHVQKQWLHAACSVQFMPSSDLSHDIRSANLFGNPILALFKIAISLVLHCSQSLPCLQKHALSLCRCHSERRAAGKSGMASCLKMIKASCPQQRLVKAYYYQTMIMAVSWQGVSRMGYILFQI